MNHDDRVRRLNGFLNDLPVQAEIHDTDIDLEKWERAICRAAAEITGLTPEVAQEAINGLGHGFEDEGLILRRFAELAEEEK
jgi:hypothetical protein